MDGAMVIQGRQVAPMEVRLIRQLIAENPSWGRSRLSQDLCRRWNWRRTNGQPKDMACRTLLLKLERAGRIALPPRQRKPPNALRHRSIPYVDHDTREIVGSLKALLPLQITALSGGSDREALFKCLISRHHYLGLKNTVGENMKYLIRDHRGRPLAALLETFVDRQRFRGTCYQAANWILVGQTQGRTRNDRHNSIQVPVKDIYVYPLSKHFRRELCRVDR